ncbi:MAG: alpha/beta hydrolase [Microbacterium sp.]|uniref:alpha/beta hydrolase n=1 Tax=Microbacterium sp. TaxID=51671 RepID=UPI0039E454F0
MRNTRRALTVVACLAAASLCLSGCVYASIPAQAPPASESAPDVTGVDPTLLSYYSQRVEWESCATGFDCAKVTVPLDYGDSSKGDIELAITRSRATNGDALGSLLVNPGGPGASGVSFVQENLSGAVGSDLEAAYDVVGFDPRGVGESTAVRCYDTAEMDEYLFGIPQAQRGTDAWTAEVDAANRAFAEACDQNSDGILPYITTENAARDLDVLRGVLGDAKLTYLGYSYGTFLGATYAGLFPQRVGRLVLDGAVDPTISGLDLGTTQAIGFESALRAYLASCLETEECPFRGTVDDAISDVQSLLATVDRDPIEASDGRMLGGSNLMSAIVTPLYAEQNWPALTEMFTEVLEGSAEFAFYLVDLYSDREDGEYLSNSTEAFRAYNCMDYPLVDDQAQLDAASALLEEKAPTFAPYWDGPDPCEQWLYTATGTREPIAAEGAAPILVVGTTNDPATPYEWSVALAEQLSSGVLITRVGEGHTGYNKGNDCVDSAVEAYFLDDVVPDGDLRCE